MNIRGAPIVPTHASTVIPQSWTCPNAKAQLRLNWVLALMNPQESGLTIPLTAACHSRAARLCRAGGMESSDSSTCHREALHTLCCFVSISCLHLIMNAVLNVLGVNKYDDHCFSQWREAIRSVIGQVGVVSTPLLLHYRVNIAQLLFVML